MPKPRLTVLLCCIVGACGSFQAAEPDANRVQAIGDVAHVTPTASGVTIACADQSEVQVTVLAPDLIRVRAAFRGPLPVRDHSWAVAKTSWEKPNWSSSETTEELHLTTDELEVVVRRSPLLVEFRDRLTHQVINADQKPMSFDPRSGGILASKRLGLDEHFYGLGEKAARLDKRRETFAMWTSDTPAYRPATDPIYQSIPFYLGWQHGVAYGVFFDNSYRSTFDFGKSAQDAVSFSAEGGELNYYFFFGPSLKKILARYADLTGHMPLPPKWALGHQQSRYSYYDAAVAADIVHRYRADDLPLDVLYLDIHYMDGYRDFTWNRERFPDPDKLTADLAQQGVKVVTIVDPGVKFQPATPGSADPARLPELAPHDQSYFVFNQGLANDYFLKRQSGELYQGRVWPGKAVFVDYTIDAAAKWWGDLHRGLLDHGVAGIWTDMNEPSDFDDKTGKTQADVVWSDGSPYAKNRNLFALGMTRATYEGLARLRPDRRPFVVTRSGYAGIQRYSTMWTGDNNSTWEALALTLPMFQSLGLSGEPFVGSDLPGFMGRADGELLARWYEAGFLTPFCRNHANNSAYDHEPWRFGPYYEGIVRKYLKLRYRLMPFLYTTLEEAHRTGVPLFRPLILNYQDDENTLDLDDQYMIGADLLAAPVLLQNSTSRHVYLPAGTWYDFASGAKHSGGTMIQADAPLDATLLYARGGSVIPMGSEMNFVDEKPDGPIALHIYPDSAGTASGSLYEDDGTSPAYLRGMFRRTETTYRESNGAATIVISRSGDFPTPARQLEIVAHGRAQPHEITVDGHRLSPIDATASSGGWFSRGDTVTARMTDDGTSHRIEWK